MSMTVEGLTNVVLSLAEFFGKISVCLVVSGFPSFVYLLVLSYILWSCFRSATFALLLDLMILAFSARFAVCINSSRRIDYLALSFAQTVSLVVRFGLDRNLGFDFAVINSILRYIVFWRERLAIYPPSVVTIRRKPRLQHLVAKRIGALAEFVIRILG